tara:strand:- start:377 stop:694 length:318 start_codon:yes stop_codon:yes gene_type:complete
VEILEIVKFLLDAPFTAFIGLGDGETAILPHAVKGAFVRYAMVVVGESLMLLSQIRKQEVFLQKYQMRGNNVFVLILRQQLQRVNLSINVIGVRMVVLLGQCMIV